MDLLPVTAEYDQISERMRQFAAAQYMEIINSLSDHVREVLSDPGGIHDIEPGRLQANMAVVKLHTTLIKELGLLYRVQDRPREDEQEPMLPVSEVEELLAAAQAREDAAVAAAAVEAERRALESVARKDVLDLDVARERVARQLRVLGR
jgi:hypothetical protein